MKKKFFFKETEAINHTGKGDEFGLDNSRKNCGASWEISEILLVEKF